MITQTYARPSCAVAPPAAKAVGPVTRAIRGLRPNEMPSWEVREAEMRRQEAADLLALRRRVAKAVTVAIAFLDETGGDPEMEESGDAEPTLCGLTSEKAEFASARFCVADGEQDAGDEPEMENEHGADDDKGEPSLCGTEVGHGDDLDREGGDDDGLADMDGWNEQRARFIDLGFDENRAGSAF